MSDNCVTEVSGPVVWPDVSKFFDETYRPDHPDLRSPESISDYHIQIDHFHGWCQETNARRANVGDFTHDSIFSAMAWLSAKGRSPHTVNKLRRVLRAIAGHATEVLDLTPTKKIKTYKTPRRNPSAWTETQICEILWVAAQLNGILGDVTLAAFVTALLRTHYNTGSRITALMLVRWEAIDLQAGMLTLKAETVKGRSVELHLSLQPETVQALAALRVGNLGGPFDYWTFDRSPLGGRRRPWKALTGLLKKVFYVALIDSDADVNTVTLRLVRKAIGRRDCTHKMRRSFATHVAAREGIEVAQELLGHADRETTLAYVDQSQMAKHSARDILPHLQAKPPKWKLFAG